MDYIDFTEDIEGYLLAAKRTYESLLPGEEGEGQWLGNMATLQIARQLTETNVQLDRIATALETIAGLPRG